MKALLQKLYASEINVGLQSFWDGGWTFWIGDEINGRREEITFDDNGFDRAEVWFAETAVRLYPGSRFAKEQSQ